MKRVFIYGAGGLGRDIAQIISDIEDIKLLGFIDDYKKNDKLIDFDVFKYEYVKNKFNDFFIVIAFGDPRLRSEAYKKIKKDNIRLVTIISKNSFVASDTEIGEGCIIYPFTIIASNVKIDDNIVISGNSSIGHDSQIDSNSFIGFNCSVGGNTRIGKNNFIGSGTHIKDELKIGNSNIIGLNSKVINSLSSNNIYYNENNQIVKNNNGTGVF